MEVVEKWQMEGVMEGIWVEVECLVEVGRTLMEEVWEGEECLEVTLILGVVEKMVMEVMVGTKEEVMEGVMVVEEWEEEVMEEEVMEVVVMEEEVMGVVVMEGEEMMKEAVEAPQIVHPLHLFVQNGATARPLICQMVTQMQASVGVTLIVLKEPQSAVNLDIARRVAI